eukprot:GFUD01012871.1.p1 GENE.GFUD01012871.1~~GFUD01012871.1.p1  ORF type:complete len:519 (+),score=122.27 GFUD01012871.1:203-1759(+)
MDRHSSSHDGEGSCMNREKADDQLLPDDYSNRQPHMSSNLPSNLPSQYCPPTHDTLPSVGEDDNLDDEVEACLVGLSGHRQGGDHSSSPTSFYSSCNKPDLGSQVDISSNSSFYSTGTVRDTDTDTASYCSVDTLRGNKEEMRQKVLDNPNDEDRKHTNYGGVIKPITDDPNLSYSRPSYLAGSTESEHTGSRSSLVSEGEVSFAGQVNDRLGRLLGYVGGAGSGEVEDALANIMGYEIVIKEKDKFTIYKIRVSCRSAVPGIWFIHRRYSDFFELRKTLTKENPKLVSQLPLPPKRWVGSNLEPAFLGRRLAGLQVFLASVLEIKDLKSSPALLSFLCLDKPPVEQDRLEANRAICDTLEEAVKELREQLRKREQVEKELYYHKNMNAEKDQQIQNLLKENHLLKQQKESLMNVLRSWLLDSSCTSLRTLLLAIFLNIKNCGRKRHSINLEDLRLEGKSKVETLQEFTAKFNLKSTEGPLASSTPSKSIRRNGDLGARRRMFSQGEETSLTSGDDKT